MTFHSPGGNAAVFLIDNKQQQSEVRFKWAGTGPCVFHVIFFWRWDAPQYFADTINYATAATIHVPSSSSFR